MLKTALLATAVMISVPALAQTQGQAGRAPQATTAAPVETPTTSDTTTDANAIPAAQAPTAATDAQAAASTATPAASATPAANATATAQPATSATQIAQVVNTEFPSYDKDANGGLNKAEFASWMVALKTASDPATKATDPATQTWVGNAFTQADKDKSAALTKDEVTAFLSQGAE